MKGLQSSVEELEQLQLANAIVSNPARVKARRGPGRHLSGLSTVGLQPVGAVRTSQCTVAPFPYSEGLQGANGLF